MPGAAPLPAPVEDDEGGEGPSEAAPPTPKPPVAPPTPPKVAKPSVPEASPVAPQRTGSEGESTCKNVGYMKLTVLSYFNYVNLHLFIFLNIKYSVLQYTFKKCVALIFKYFYGLWMCV